ncbi:hypothetical protein LV779_31325 [Streptomyces thinghirensis]|nr:hypothetical protein [Streptomyces thinghirensis]
MRSEHRPFTAQFPSSPRGAQLARRHAVRWLEGRGHPPTSVVSCTAALVAGELAANAGYNTVGSPVTSSASGSPSTGPRACYGSRSTTPPSAKRLPMVAPSSYPEGESDCSWWTSWPCGGARFRAARPARR